MTKEPGSAPGTPGPGVSVTARPRDPMIATGAGIRASGATGNGTKTPGTAESGAKAAEVVENGPKASEQITSDAKASENAGSEANAPGATDSSTQSSGVSDPRHAAATDRLHRPPAGGYDDTSEGGRVDLIGSGGDGPLVPGVSVLAALALAWLAAMLWSTQGTIGRAAEGSDIGLTSAALALPGVISASLIGGAAVGLAGVDLLARWRLTALERVAARLTWGTCAGLLTGLAVATPIALGYDGLPSIMVLAGAVAAAAAMGGALAAVQPIRVVAAGVTGALGVFAVTFVLNIFSPNLLHLYGAGDTGASRFTANAWLALTMSLLSGLVAGLLAYGYLRRHAGQLRWPAYLVAGALSGLLTMLAELVTRLGGAHLFRVASAVSADDSAYLRYLNTARINRAMVILFVGALTALILFGRTLRPAEAEADADLETADNEPADIESADNARTEIEPAGGAVADAGP